MHSMYMVLNKVTLYTGAWLHGVLRTCARSAAFLCGVSHSNSQNRAVGTLLQWILF